MTCSAFPLVAILLALTTILGAPSTHAQVSTDPVLTIEGISGDMDKKRRGPVLSVGVNRNQADSSSAAGGGVGSTTLLVDAFVPNKEYERYPIRFDFFVNRKLVSSQLRSVELPGPIGLLVTPEMGTIPFNYSVVATLLHPNREFTTILHGAVTSAAPTPPTTSLSSCNLEIVPAEGAELTVYVADTVTVTPGEDGNFSISFQTSKLDDGSQSDPVSATADFTVSNGEVTGTITTSVNGNEETVDISGSAVVENDSLQSIEVKPETGATALSCS
jgi:hypothetical protein